MATSSLADIVATQDKLESRFQASKTLSLLDQLITDFEERKAALKTGQIAPAATAVQLKTTIDRFSKAIADDQKETYNAHARHGKAIAKRFKTDLTAATNPEVFVGKTHLINNAIALNFVRQGQFETAWAFANEAKLDIDSSLVHNFESMYHIVKGLEENDLTAAIAWATEHGTVLQQRNSTLGFELHKAQFQRIFRNEHVFHAIDYAQKNFAPFATKHLRDIQQLMAATAYHAKIADSPYAHLFAEQDSYRHVKQLFITEFTALLEMTPTSPLQTTIEAANLALPTLIKLSSLKIATAKDGNGVDLPLPKNLRFHSVFVCPVTKEVGGDAWMLACGHVIGGEAMHSLAKGTGKLKCPYCPAVSEVRDGLKLIF